MEASLNTISVSKSLSNDLASLAREMGKIKSLFYQVALVFLKHKLTRLKRQGAKRVIVSLDSIYLLSIGALDMIGSYNKETAKRELSNIRKLIAEFDSLKKVLEQHEFYQNETLKERTSMCFSVLFDLELNLKKIAYKDEAKQADTLLKEAMASSSHLIAEALK